MPGPNGEAERPRASAGLEPWAHTVSLSFRVHGDTTEHHGPLQRLLGVVPARPTDSAGVSGTAKGFNDDYARPP
jgi:hypothetical protein